MGKTLPSMISKTPVSSVIDKYGNLVERFEWPETDPTDVQLRISMSERSEITPDAVEAWYWGTVATQTPLRKLATRLVV